MFLDYFLGELQSCGRMDFHGGDYGDGDGDVHVHDHDDDDDDDDGDGDGDVHDHDDDGGYDDDDDDDDGGDDDSSFLFVCLNCWECWAIGFEFCMSQHVSTGPSTVLQSLFTVPYMYNK